VLALFEGWTLQHLADGVALLPPEGRAIGAIRIRDQVRPLRRVRDVIDAAADELRASAEDVNVATPVSLATDEGEYGFLARITGTAGGVPFVRVLGLVYSDDFYHRIDGVTTSPQALEQLAELVRMLTVRSYLGLGERRRRRFLYDPPPGWTGMPRGLTTVWLAPGFPEDPATITVPPARPVADLAAGPATLEGLLRETAWHGFRREWASPPAPFVARAGLRGSRWTITGRAADGVTSSREVVALADARFWYVLRLDCPRPTHEATFATLCESVAPLPLPATTVAELSHWAD
jgi:hypothetical protein